MHYKFIDKLNNSNIDLKVIDTMICKDCNISINSDYFSLQFNFICYIGTIVIRDNIFDYDKFNLIINDHPYTHIEPEIALKYLNRDYYIKFD